MANPPIQTPSETPFDMLAAKIASVRAQSLKSLNQSLFADDGVVREVKPLTPAETRHLRRERLKRLVQVRDIDDDWDDY